MSAGACVHDGQRTAERSDEDAPRRSQGAVGGECARPRARGKFLFVGEDKLYVRGATYGTFRPDAGGRLYPAPAVVARDFSKMAANGFNAVRTYTVPPRWLLDVAAENGLFVMVGVAWEQHVDFICFNVYLERRAALDAYLARLHNVTGDRPLVMAEIGLDSRTHGELAQADVLGWQIATAFSSGCAGAFVFAWTDDWYVSYLS